MLDQGGGCTEGEACDRGSILRLLFLSLFLSFLSVVFKEAHQMPSPTRAPNDIDAFANEIWENLDANNKISLYVRYVSLEDGSVQNRMFNKNV